MSSTGPGPGRTRRRRGRPKRAVASGSARDTGPTRPRLVALRVLARVERTRAYADLALHQALSQSGLPGPDRALATELVYGTLRWRGHLDFLLSKVVERDLAKLEPMVASVLRLGAYQLVFLDRIPESAAVDQAVRCARAIGAERATGLVNAALRRLARERANFDPPSLEADPVGHLCHGLSLPRWLAERFIDLLGPEEAALLARALNETPPLVVRTNRRKITRDLLCEELRPRFPDLVPCPLSRDGIALGHGGDPATDPAFLAGRFSVQDEASQLVVALLDPQPGERILDTCAAPGSKSAAIAERVGPRDRVLALDRHPKRLALVTRGARRLDLGNIVALARDATHDLSDLVAEQNGFRFDRILVDAPCSGLGSLRRNPDARWRIQAHDPAQLASLQGALLDRASEVLKPGGTLVYSTCTLLPEENEKVVEAFLDRHSHFEAVPRAELPRELYPVLDETGTLRCWPHREKTDGFYAAALRSR